MTWIFHETFNTPKLHIMQKMQARVLIRYSAWKYDSIDPFEVRGPGRTFLAHFHDIFGRKGGTSMHEEAASDTARDMDSHAGGQRHHAC